MTREEAARVLKYLWIERDENAKSMQQLTKSFFERQEALRIGAAALRGPQPDPVTGLVPCGCGGKAEIRKWEWSNDSYIAGCTVCDANVDFPYDIDETDKIISDWNRAMGRRAEE